VTIKGRVASLLEVGTGFHPELSGRENIYLNGTILGMTRKEIKKKFDEIVAFAEVEKYLDTPVKRYSSGMYVRLAFAVAAHLEPEILVVDEVLAVGDAQFQKKCLGKMGDVAKGGRTVLFVSHNMAAVSHLCSSCVILKNGKLIAEGESNHIVEIYLSDNNDNNPMDLTSHENRISNGAQALQWITIKGHNQQPLVTGQPAIVTIGFDRQKISSAPEVGFTIETLLGRRVFSFATYWVKRTPEMNFTNGVASCLIPKIPLTPGIYTINIAVGPINNPLQDSIYNTCQFEVLSADYYGTGKIPSSNHGVVLVDASWYAVLDSNVICH
jgi:lipopolysaccharide transport system ATP-binding protein